MPEATAERMRERLQSLSPQQLRIEDESAQHAGHAGLMQREIHALAMTLLAPDEAPAAPSKSPPHPSGH